VGVYVSAGSRQEDFDNTGSNYLLSKMLLRGTSSKSKSQLHQDIENMGARYHAHAGREITYQTLKCFPGDVQKGVKILGDMISNPSLNGNEFELLKEEVS
jgi:predicted Zn-dependent peptidase